MFANNTGADQPAYPCSLTSAFAISFLESIVSRLATREFSNSLPVCVAEESGLILPFSKTPKTGFVARVILLVNPCMPIVFSHPYQLDESISNFRIVVWYFSFLFKIVSKQWRTGPDATYCGVWPGSALFANVPQKGQLGVNGLSASHCTKNDSVQNGMCPHQWTRSTCSPVQSVQRLRWVLYG